LEETKKTIESGHHLQGRKEFVEQSERADTED
jgi:hypothetical protein